MNLVTNFYAIRNNVAQLASWTEDQLSALATSIAAGWQVQHDAEGHHADVTCTSLVVNGATALNGPLAFRNIVRVGLQAATAVAPLTPAIDGTAQTQGLPVQNFNILKIRPKVGADTIRGLTNLNRLEGDRIVIFNVGNVDLLISLIDTACPVGQRFIDDTTTAEPTFGVVTLGSAGWVEAMYLQHEFFNQSYWCLSGIRQ